MMQHLNTSLKSIPFSQGVRGFVTSIEVCRLHASTASVSDNLPWQVLFVHRENLRLTYRRV